MTDQTIEGEVIPAQQKVKEFKTVNEMCNFLSLIQPKNIVVQTFRDEQGYQLIWSSEQ